MSNLFYQVNNMFKKILFFFLVMFFLGLTFGKKPIYATGYCSGWNGNPYTSCYFYPPWVSASVNACSWGNTTGINVQWNGQNCDYHVYGISWYDNGVFKEWVADFGTGNIGSFIYS